MPLFAYKVARADGTTFVGEVEDDDEIAVRNRLEGQGFLVFRVRRQGIWSVGSVGSIGVLGFATRWTRLPPQQFLIFNQELLALMRSGLPVLKVWDLLIERAQQAGFRETLRSVRQDIRGGASASDALARHPEYFSELYVATLKAGEQAGNVPEVLQRYVSHLKLMIGLRQKVWKALTYPLFLVAVGVCVIGFLLTYVMPTFIAAYGEQARTLPMATQWLLGVIHTLRVNLFTFVIGFLVAVLAGRAWHRTEAGRLTADRFLLRVPFLGAVLWRHYTVQLTRTLSTVLGGGTPLVEALHISRSAISNRSIGEGLARTVEQVRDGSSLTAALRQPPVIPLLAVEMLAVGEETGSLETMLKDVAEFYESELDVRLTQLTTWIEPALLLVMGLLVGGIVVIMYLPVFQMAGSIQ
ncbi:MAG: type II secretion system F family protein [Nitrospiraceae bacterium]